MRQFVQVYKYKNILNRREITAIVLNPLKSTMNLQNGNREKYSGPKVGLVTGEHPTDIEQNRKIQTGARSKRIDWTSAADYFS